MCNDVVLAIDTSNYTTSVAVVSLDGELLLNLKQLLSVKSGERGLRQSDALFLHTVNIPSLMEQVRDVLLDKRIACIGVSDRPRSVEGSYMPCFLAGVSAASSIAASLGVPLYRFSHQDGHIMAALYSADAMQLIAQKFAAFHVSGGTTELLRVTPGENTFHAECVGGTADLNAGQLIDRIGVYMGLGFPCGPEIEKLALKNTEKIPKKRLSFKGNEVNLSGLENIACKLFDDTQNKELTSAFVLDYIGRALSGLSDAYIECYGDSPIVYAGGVMSNSIIKDMLGRRPEVYFAKPAMSSDNAVGTAILALRKYEARCSD